MRTAFIAIFLLTTYLVTAQKLSSSDYADYITKYKSVAIREMKLYQIPASITLAQGMIESGCGKSVLAVDSKNHFGIKCQKEWTGDKYYYDDDVANECFRKYKSIDESYRDHSMFLTTRKRYAALFTLPMRDYKGWAIGLKQAGYATNPEYANILIRLIENNQLYLFDDTSAFRTGEIAVLASGAHHKQSKPSLADMTSEGYVSNEGRVIFRTTYKMPVAADFKYLFTSKLGRKVYENYNVPFIFAQKGDTWFTIAEEFSIYSFQVYRYNDLLKGDAIRTGQMLYLESKKKKSPDKAYTVKKGDSMYSISQEKCIKLRLLLKYNKFRRGVEPKPGFALKLRR